MTRQQQLMNENIEEIIKWKALNGTLPNFCFMTPDNQLWLRLITDLYTVEKDTAP